MFLNGNGYSLLTLIRIKITCKHKAIGSYSSKNEDNSL